MYEPPSAETIMSMPTTIQLLIELESDNEPIAGTIRQLPDRRTTAFAGWLQFTEMIEAVRRSPTRTPEETTGDTAPWPPMTTHLGAEPRREPSAQRIHVPRVETDTVGPESNSPGGKDAR
jgi:hypothetical protein